MLAAELVSRRVAVLAALGGELSALAGKQATSTIPIVAGIGGDPVRSGLVESISRPADGVYRNVQFDGAKAAGYVA